MIFDSPLEKRILEEIDHERRTIEKSLVWKRHQEEHEGAALVVMKAKEDILSEAKKAANEESLDDITYFTQKHVPMGCGCGMRFDIEDGEKVRAYIPRHEMGGGEDLIDRNGRGRGSYESRRSGASSEIPSSGQSGSQYARKASRGTYR